jgi:hypothetical protein
MKSTVERFALIVMGLLTAAEFGSPRSIQAIDWYRGSFSGLAKLTL